MGSPVMHISKAKERGTRLANRVTPPAAATRPTLTSGIPSCACSAAVAKSQARTISRPPPRAAPLTAAMVGLRCFRWVKPANPPCSVKILACGPSRANAFKSIPEQNASSPVPVITTTHTSSSAS